MAFIRKNLANGFTLLNMFLGFAGIINVLYHDEITGCYMLFIAAIADLLDGMVARLMKSTSSIGKQLDSLSDVVSFGILPAVILHSLILRSHQQWVYTLTFVDIPVISFIPFLFAAAASIRLARYNEDPGQKYYFKGLPTPAAGMFVASLPLIINSDLVIFGYNTFYFKPYLLNAWTLLSICILLSVLMLANIPLFSLKFPDFKLKTNFLRYSIIILFVLFYLLFNFMAFPLTLTFYVLLSLIFRNKITN